LNRNSLSFCVSTHEVNHCIIDFVFSELNHLSCLEEQNEIFNLFGTIKIYAKNLKNKKIINDYNVDIEYLDGRHMLINAKTAKISFLLNKMKINKFIKYLKETFTFINAKYKFILVDNDEINEILKHIKLCFKAKFQIETKENQYNRNLYSKIIRYDYHKCETICITATMNRRWMPQFVALLKTMQQYGELGHSDNLTFFADGDGDFKPKFEIKSKEEIEKVEPIVQVLTTKCAYFDAD
jgi:hypothetical protein